MPPKKEELNYLKITPVRNIIDAVNQIAEFRGKNPWMPFSTLVDIDNTVTDGSEAILSQIPFVSFVTPLGGLIPEENINALLYLNDITSGKFALVTNRGRKSPLWASGKLESYISERLTTLGLNIPIFHNLDRQIPITWPFYRPHRYDELVKWLYMEAGQPGSGIQTQDIKVFLISDKNLFAKTDRTFLKGLRSKLDSRFVFEQFRLPR